MQEFKALLKRLVEPVGVSGYESSIRDVITAELSGVVDELRSDALGNLIAVKKANGPRVMLAAHMDRIGLMVTHIGKKGFLRVTPIGGIFDGYASTRPVRFESGVQGFVHYEEKTIPRGSAIPLSAMFIDIGASSHEEAAAKVKIGDVACYDAPFIDMGDRVSCAALDNRAGCAVLIEMFKRLTETANEIVGVFTVQEEVGLRGAITSAYQVEPDVGIALDVTATNDTPKPLPVATAALGAGAAIKIKDLSLISHPAVNEWLFAAAERDNVPVQADIIDKGGTDAGAIRGSRCGVPSSAISIPTRYIHSPGETISMTDMEACVNLLLAAMKVPAPKQ